MDRKAKAPSPGGGNGASYSESNVGKYTRKTDAFHWWPHYFAEHYLDTSHLTPEAYTALGRLKDFYASHQNALPDDDVVLARVAGLDINAWRKARPMVEPFFDITDQWKHRDIDLLVARAEAMTEQRRRAANTRWGKPAEANAMQEQSKCYASASDSQSTCNEIQNQNQTTTRKGALLGPDAGTDADADADGKFPAVAGGAA